MDFAGENTGKGIVVLELNTETVYYEGICDQFKGVSKYDHPQIAHCQ